MYQEFVDGAEVLMSEGQEEGRARFEEEYWDVDDDESEDEESE